MTSSNLSQLIKRFQDVGVFRLYFKLLAANDNSKNQVYLGSDFQVINIIPNSGIVREEKRLKAKVDFWWLSNVGKIHQAPAAQLILYPQYPEVRFSGFLRGCKRSPSDLMRSREEGRVLFLGVTRDDRIIGYVVSSDHSIAKAIGEADRYEEVGVFRRISLGDENQQTLLEKLRGIHLKGWIDSYRLNSKGDAVACNASNCGGYTLEAELGVTPNGDPVPDYLGYEIKQYGVSDFDRGTAKSPLTLMTPEPTSGFYKDAGAEAFVRKYGYPDTGGRPDRLNFGGIYRFGKKAKRTGLTLLLTGYDLGKGKINSADGGIVLLDDDGKSAAVWDFSALMGHWSQKHAKAVYVPSLLRTDPLRQYKYGQKIYLGRGADFLTFLKGVAQQDIYYDPAVKVENAFTGNPRTKRRSQFRIKVASLESLYRLWSEIDLLDID